MKSVLRIYLFFFMALLLSPDGIRIAHVLMDHEHFVCENYTEKHFHKDVLDCELCDFQQNNFPQVNLFFTEEISIIQKEGLKIGGSYRFLEDYQSLPFALRGPPIVS